MESDENRSIVPFAVDEEANLVSCKPPEESLPSLAVPASSPEKYDFNIYSATDRQQMVAEEGTPPTVTIATKSYASSRPRLRHALPNLSTMSMSSYLANNTGESFRNGILPSSTNANILPSKIFAQNVGNQSVRVTNRGAVSDDWVIGLSTPTSSYFPNKGNAMDSNGMQHNAASALNLLQAQESESPEEITHSNHGNNPIPVPVPPSVRVASRPLPPKPGFVGHRTDNPIVYQPAQALGSAQTPTPKPAAGWGNRGTPRPAGDNSNPVRDRSSTDIADNSLSYVAAPVYSPSTQMMYIRTVKIRFFSLGIISGASLQLFFISILIMCITSASPPGIVSQYSQLYFPVFRCIFLICFYFVLHGICVFIWKRNNVDYLTVLCVSYAHTHQYILQGSATLIHLVLSCFLIFIATLVTGMNLPDLPASRMRHVWPAVAVLLPGLLFALPLPDTWTKNLYGVEKNGYSQRQGLLSDLWQIALSPWSTTSFLRSYVTDILCSMPAVFQDIHFTVCLYVTATWLSNNGTSLSLLQASAEDNNFQMAAYQCSVGSSYYFTISCIFRILPFYLRFCQCLRGIIDKPTMYKIHTLNAVKYLVSMAVAMLSQMLTVSSNSDHQEIWRRAWFIVGSVATLYSFVWDVVMDWGLGNMNSRHRGLRDKLMLQKNWYYIAIVLNFLGRIGWAIVISPGQPFIAQQVVLLLGVVELFRRAMWGILRVEWEHVRLQLGCPRSRTPMTTYSPRADTTRTMSPRTALEEGQALLNRDELSTPSHSQPYGSINHH